MALTQCPSCWGWYAPEDAAKHATPCQHCGGVYHPTCLCPKTRAPKK